MSTELQQINELATAALERFGLDRDSSVALCNVSENHTYRVDDPGTGSRFALRVHRPGYHTRAEIESELSWIDALSADGVVQTPGVVRATDGERVVSVAGPELGERNVVLFEWLAGAEPDLDSGEAAAAQLNWSPAGSCRP